MAATDATVQPVAVVEVPGCTVTSDPALLLLAVASEQYKVIMDI